MPLADKLQEQAAKYIAEIVLTLVLSGLAAIGFLADRLFPSEAFEVLGRFATGQIALGLFLTILGLIAWIVYLHPILSFDERTGTFLHKRTGMRYCARCLINKRVKSPLRINADGRGWRCEPCTGWFANPDYNEPPPPPQSRDRWMRI